MILFFAERKHYVDHMAPICNLLKSEAYFVSPSEICSYITDKIGAGKTMGYSDEKNFAEILSSVTVLGEPLVGLASSCCTSIRISDSKIPIDIIRMDHGNGQTISCADPSWSRRYSLDPCYRNIKWFLMPNEESANVVRRNNPGIEVHVIGTPKLDRIPMDIKMIEKNTADSNNLVVFSWHWECSAAPEVFGGFEYWKDAILAVKDRFNIALHGHPRIHGKVSSFCKENSIRFIEDFDEVLNSASLYVCDYSSTIYEFATIKPVLILNNPWFSRGCNHGMRFWKYADIGINCWDKDKLGECLSSSMSPENSIDFKRATSAMYPYFGSSSKRAAETIEAIYRSL